MDTIKDSSNMGASQSPGSFLTPLLISLAGLVGTTIAIVGYHLFLLRYCVHRRRARAASLQSGTSIGSGGPPIPIGVEKQVLDAIPVFSFRRNTTDNAQTECVICLGEIEDGEKARLLPTCGHVFHVFCVDDWFMAHTSCPICRAPISSPVVESDLDQSGQFPLEERNDQETVMDFENVSDLAWQQEQEQEQQEEHPSSGNEDQKHLLRHSISLVLPADQEKTSSPQEFITLKRSLSMDHSFIAIDIQRDGDQKNIADAVAASSSSLKAILVDRMSLGLLKSFSQMRIGSSVATAGGVLPR